MSRGPGRIEARIADLFAATRGRALSVDEIADNAYELNGAKPSREQRLAATRAAHRLLKRIREARDRQRKLRRQADVNTEKALGREKRGYSREHGADKEFQKRLKTDPAYKAAEKLFEFTARFGSWFRVIDLGGGRRIPEDEFWTAETVKGRLLFHPADAPVRVWAVAMGPGGITWAEAEVVRITERNVVVRYAGEHARLDRDKLWRWWVFWRGVRFVSSQSGRIAGELDEEWLRRYGGDSLPVSMRMPLSQAMDILGVPDNFTKEDILSAFRRKAKAAHPDVGGTAEQFRLLVEARDRLLQSVGTSAPKPKEPKFAPIGTRFVTRRRRSSSTMIGATRRLAGARSLLK